MNKTKSLFFPALLTAFLLVGCKGANITPEKAAERAQEIETKVASDDYESPTKFSLKQELRTNALTEDTMIAKGVANFDLDAKYFYVETSIESGEESEYEKAWVYYDVKKDTTYAVFDENGEKSHVTFEGNTFSDLTEFASIHEAIGSLNLAALLALADEDDNRNVYRSAGEGSIYLKIYTGGTDSDAYGEVEISNYRPVLIKQYNDADNFIDMSVKYSGVSTAKPNLNDYPSV